MICYPTLPDSFRAPGMCSCAVSSEMTARNLGLKGLIKEDRVARTHRSTAGNTSYGRNHASMLVMRERARTSRGQRNVWHEASPLPSFGMIAQVVVAIPTNRAAVNLHLFRNLAECVSVLRTTCVTNNNDPCAIGRTVTGAHRWT